MIHNLKTIPIHSPYCVQYVARKGRPCKQECPYWRFEYNKNASTIDGKVIHEGYCLYYKDWLLDDDVRLLECLVEWGDDY